jgi:ABC-type multidrug transport system ATPase subunit
MTTAPSPRPVAAASRADQACALVLQGCHRSYGPVLALAPVTLRVHRGAVCTVTGPNGSGKTTLLRIAAGLLQPSGGQRTGADPAVYVAAGDGGRGSQTVAQAIGVAARLGGGDVEEAIEVADLSALRASTVGELSAGQRTRVTLATVLAGNPAIACLDEPESHLDADGVRCAARVVDHLAGRGAAVLVATHDHRWLRGRHDGHLQLSPSAEGSS